VSPRSRSTTGFRRALTFLRRHAGYDAFPKQFELLGRRWTLLHGVFSPIDTPITELFTSWVPYPTGGAFLEIGCGTGITAVVAAMAGCRRVVAVDVNRAAVENTLQNAERHGVSDRVSVRQGDLYDALAPDERFDMIYWNSNFIEVPHDRVLESDLDHAFFDPGYGTHRRYLGGAASHLNEGGRLLLGFSSLGSWPEFGRACSETAWEPRILRTEHRQLGSMIEFQLVELMDVDEREQSVSEEGAGA